MPSSNGLIPVPGSGSRMPRSVFKRSVKGGCSMNYGRVYPIFMQYQEANTSKAFDLASLLRGATPIVPVMGNANMDIHAFSVPWRIVWNYTKQFFGENDTSAWTQQNEYQKPQIELRLGHLIIAPMDFAGGTDEVTATNSTLFSEVNDGEWVYNRDLALIGQIAEPLEGYTLGGVTYADDKGLGLFVDMMTSDFYGPNKLADYLGLHPIPKNAEMTFLRKFLARQNAAGADLKISVDALPFRAFFSVINYYYRDQNYQAPYLFSKDNETLKLSIVDGESNRLPMPYDFMQYRPSGIALENPDSGFDETFEGSAFVPPASRLRDPFSTFVPEPLKGEQYDLLSIAGLAPVVGDSSGLHEMGAVVFGNSGGSVPAGQVFGVGGSGALAHGNDSSFSAVNYATRSNLYADLAAASKITLEKFRDFVVLNQWNEKAVKGTRFAEILNEFYGVPVNPALLDEPRFLGGVSIPIASWQVTQTAPNSDGSGVGDLSAFTHTKDNSSLFVFNFDEPSILLVCAVARVEHTFAQQVDPHWFRKDKFDEHYALFDGLGYQPLDKRIPYLPAGVLSDNGGDIGGDVLGFQESYWEERYQLGNMAGVLNASNHMSLDYWNYNELPTEHPTAGPEYLSAYRDADIVDRTLQLGEQASLYAEQLICDFTFQYTEAKVISSRMDPGLTRI